MLSPETPYPYPGSYALYEDPELPAEQRSAELVRILWRAVSTTAVSFPLRAGASGTKVVVAADLIDASPLATEELREFHDLDRALRGRSLRTPKQKRQATLRDAFLSRVIWAPHMARLLREMRARLADRQAA